MREANQQHPMVCRLVTRGVQPSAGAARVRDLGTIQTTVKTGRDRTGSLRPRLHATWTPFIHPATLLPKLLQVVPLELESLLKEHGKLSLYTMEEMMEVRAEAP